MLTIANKRSMTAGSGSLVIGACFCSFVFIYGGTPDFVRRVNPLIHEMNRHPGRGMVQIYYSVFVLLLAYGPNV